MHTLVRIALSALAVGPGILPAAVFVETITASPTFVDTQRGEDRYELGFYPPHAPARYSAQEIADAIAPLAPGETATLLETTQRQLLCEEVLATTTCVDLNGNIFGADLAGDPFDLSSWTTVQPGDLTISVTESETRAREFNDLVFSEVVRKQEGTQGTVDVAIWSYTVPSDTVESSSKTLRYTPATVPNFIPAAWVQAAQAGASPGDVVPMGSATFEYDALKSTRFASEVVEAFNVQPGVDYIGNPDDYGTWIAITPNRIQVNVLQRIEQGPTYLRQERAYQLVIPDSTGEIIINPGCVEFVREAELLPTWDRVWFASGSAPVEVDPADVAIAAGKLAPGEHAMVLHKWTDTPGSPTTVVTDVVDAHGAVQGVDYSGSPADPSSWTALTSEDVVADRIERRTVRTSTPRANTAYELYVESGSGRVTIVETNVIGSRTTTVSKRFVDAAIDPASPPPGVTAEEIAGALQWAGPGESVIVGRAVEREVLSSTLIPLGEIVDTNQWTYGVDFTGDPGDRNTWTATGPFDVYIDVFNQLELTEVIEEVCTNYIVTAPLDHVPGPVLASVAVNDEPNDPLSHVTVEWLGPVCVGFEVEYSTGLEMFLPLGACRQFTFPRNSFRWFAPSGGPLPPAAFFRVRRK